MNAAVVIKEPGRAIEIEEREPPVPGPDEVLIRVRACGQAMSHGLTGRFTQRPQGYVGIRGGAWNSSADKSGATRVSFDYARRDE